MPKPTRKKRLKAVERQTIQGLEEGLSQHGFIPLDGLERSSRNFPRLSYYHFAATRETEFFDVAFRQANTPFITSYLAILSVRLLDDTTPYYEVMDPVINLVDNPQVTNGPRIVGVPELVVQDLFEPRYIRGYEFGLVPNLSPEQAAQALQDFVLTAHRHIQKLGIQKR